MPVAPRPTGPARRTRLLALGAAATVGALALAGCTKSEEAPEPLTIDVVGGAFPDALGSGILEVLGENLDTGYSTAMLDDGAILVPGSSDGIVDDSVGILDPTTGEVDWVVTADVAEGTYVMPGDVTERWVTWSVESDEGVTPEDAIPFVFALDRESQKTYVLADGTSEGGFAPGTTGSRVLIAGDLAVWEGALPVEGADGAAGGGTGADEGESGDDATDADELLDGEELPLDEGDPVTSSVFARPLDASGGVVTVAAEAGALVRDDCLDGSPITAQVTTDVTAERRTVTAEGALGAVLAPLALGDGEEVSLRCGAGGAVETYSEDGGVASKVVLRGGERDIVLVGDGVADLQVVGMTTEWAAVWVGDLDTALGQQLVVHRPSGKVFSLGESESQLLVVRPGVVAFGGPVDLAPLGEDGLEDEDLEDLEDLGEAGDDDGSEPDVTEGEAGGSDGGSDEASDDASDEASDDASATEGDVEVVEEDDVDPEGEDLFQDDFSGGALTTVGRLVAPKG